MPELNAREMILSLPERYKSERNLDGFEAIMHMIISGDNGGDYTVKVENDKCSIKEGIHGEADCVIKAKDKIYEDIETGRKKAQMAMLLGQLKISNIPLATDFMGLFKKIRNDE